MSEHHSSTGKVGTAKTPYQGRGGDRSCAAGGEQERMQQMQERWEAEQRLWLKGAASGAPQNEYVSASSVCAWADANEASMCT